MLEDAQRKEFDAWVKLKFSTPEVHNLLKREGVRPIELTQVSTKLDAAPDLLAKIHVVHTKKITSATTHCNTIRLTRATGEWLVMGTTDLIDLATYLAEQANAYGLLEPKMFDPFDL